MFKEIGVWYKSDKYNIFLTILCMIVSLAPSWWRYVEDIISWNASFENGALVMIGVFILVLSGMVQLIRIFFSSVIDDARDKQPLQDYIEEVCRIKQTQNQNSESAYRVVKGTVRQFFIAWQIIWILWILYYGIEVILCVSTDDFRDNTKYAFQVSEYFLDFVTSVALFSVYYILNNATVDISKRTSTSLFTILAPIACGIILFGVLVILQIIYLSHITIMGDAEAIECDAWTKLILGFFGTISFVLVLGKLNSSYLKVPRGLMFVLYIYAISQLFSSFGDVGDNKEAKKALEIITIVKPWISLFGKAALLMALSWILYKKRLIFYIIHESLSITDNSRRLNKFNRYMSD